MDYEEALELCDKIVEGCEMIPEAGEDFAESVREKTESMRDWIQAKRVVTEKMATALVNMKGGVEKWFHGRPRGRRSDDPGGYNDEEPCGWDRDDDDEPCRWDRDEDR